MQARKIKLDLVRQGCDTSIVPKGITKKPVNIDRAKVKEENHMTTLNVTFDLENSPRFPVYLKYGGQHQAQPAYLYLDLRDGECGAGYNGEIGSTPLLQWHSIVLTFPIAAETMAAGISDLIESHKEAFQVILDDSKIEWDGNNNAGKFGDKATEELVKLGFFMDENGANPEGTQSYDSLVTMIDSDYFPEWLGDTIDTNHDLESLAETLINVDGEGGCYFSDDMNSSDAILYELKHVWSERLYSGDDIPQEVAQYLLDDGFCDDSQWVDELKEFAQG